MPELLLQKALSIIAECEEMLEEYEADISESEDEIVENDCIETEVRHNL